jgi:RNA polymerase sigma-70 factor (ECF subfamily)
VTTPPERELIERARAGDEHAFELLVRAHSDQVYGALRHFGLDPDESGEVAQEVFLRAWRGLAGFEGRAQLSTWLYRIAFNEAQRRLARRPPRTSSSGPGGEDPLAAVPDAEDRGPAAQALEREFATALEAALQQLPADWRAAVVLRDIEGLSTIEAAEIASVGTTAFKSRLHRGRMQLRTLLAPYLAAT